MTDITKASWKLITPDDVLREAEEHAKKWAQASLATDLCDQEKIETFLKKRAGYLANPARKLVWCTSIEDFIQQISHESSRSLLADQHALKEYKDAVEREMFSQLKAVLKRYSPTTEFSNFLGPLRVRIEQSLAPTPEKKPKNVQQQKIDQTVERLREMLKEYFWMLYVREGKHDRPIERLKEFWNELFDFSSCRFYDCLFECLPDKERIKNYFAYMGQMHEAGLWIYIPSKTADYVIPIPSRFFIGSPQGSRDNTPRIEWKNAYEKPRTTSPNPAPHDTERILAKLSAFQTTLDAFSLQEELTRETQKVIEKISHLLTRLKKEYPSSSLGYEVRRIADSWLIELITSYASLSPSNREKKRQTLLENLTLLDSQIDEILENLEMRKVSEFDIITTFLRDTFGANSIRA
jgi:hypothetical protein